MRIVSLQSERAVVHYGHFSAPLVVRLLQSTRGWELLELPTHFGPSDCVAEEVEYGGDPFRCDV